MTVKAPTLLVMAGGTGGHIFPGLAVADELKQQGWNIHWLGTAERMEAQIVPKHGYDISFIDIKGLRNKRIIDLLIMPFKLAKSLWQAISVIKSVQPDVVLGMGGYASGPGGIAAWLMGKPVVLHEQNAAAGLTNRLLARIASVVCSAFPGAFAGKLSEKVTVEVVGNPLRSAIGKQGETKARHETKNILVVGGSLGAQVLNNTLPFVYNELAKQAQDYCIWHQTGKGNLADVQANYNSADIDTGKVQVTEFIDDMAFAYQWADIVICRAGALTVSELAMAATPAIFIPLPHAVDDHQTKNAQFLVERGAAKLIAQSKLSKESLTTQISELFADENTLKDMAKAAYLAADKDATQKVANFCQRLIRIK